MQAKTIGYFAGIAVAAALSIGTASAQAQTAYPAHEAGVRAAAAQGPDALRWYVQRTRMIHQFYFNDFARGLPER
jgi:hypothetical protein